MADKLEASAGSIDLELELDESVEELEASRTASKRENPSSAPLTPKALNRPGSLGHSLSSVSSVESSLAKNSKSARSVSFGHGAGSRSSRAGSFRKRFASWSTRKLTPSCLTPWTLTAALLCAPAQRRL